MAFHPDSLLILHLYESLFYELNVKSRVEGRPIEGLTDNTMVWLPDSGKYLFLSIGSLSFVFCLSTYEAEPESEEA